MRVRDDDGQFQLQKNTLRFLCSVLIKSGTRSEICKLLDPGVFDDPLHRVVFEEIREMGAVDSRRLRELSAGTRDQPWIPGLRPEAPACTLRSERKRRSIIYLRARCNCWISAIRTKNAALTKYRKNPRISAWPHSLTFQPGKRRGITNSSGCILPWK